MGQGKPVRNISEPPHSGLDCQGMRLEARVVDILDMNVSQVFVFPHLVP